MNIENIVIKIKDTIEHELPGRVRAYTEDPAQNFRPPPKGYRPKYVFHYNQRMPQFDTNNTLSVRTTLSVDELTEWTMLPESERQMHISAFVKRVVDNVQYVINRRIEQEQGE